MSRVAVVTGGASGIGLGVATQFVADGHRVAILDRANADVAAKEINALGIDCDVSDRAAVDVAFEQVRSELGPVEILCTAAGIDLFQPLHEVTMDDWDRVIAVNLTGTFSCVQQAVPDMVAAKWGRVITIASSSAESGAPNMAHYTASKGGVISLTRSIAVEFARSGITSNSITPSICDTPMARKAAEAGKVPDIAVLGGMVPVGRAGLPEDIAAAVSFLASDAASYVTGQILGVSGGMRI
ncbi:MAG: 2-hydroxycyclohexanecarboxyl-CoA dehydrogenase [Actinomycetota bacterium]|jgi:NAD(P)-dependent dehydrogenase (short-subunit alcohol dehydrogenase family)